LATTAASAHALAACPEGNERPPSKNDAGVVVGSPIV
jgi:hypothetical protein